MIRLYYYGIILFTVSLVFSQLPTIREVEKSFGKPAFFIPRTTTPPVIDGDLNDAVWQDIQSYQLDHFDGCSSPIEAPTTVKFLCNDSGLYVAAYCTEPRMDLALSSGVWNGDIVGLCVDPDHTHPKMPLLARLKINLNGQCDLSGAEVRVTKGSDHWTCEFFVQWNLLWISPDNIPTIIGFNFFRIRPQVGLTNPCNCMAAPAVQRVTNLANSRYGENTSLAPFWLDYKRPVGPSTTYDPFSWGPVEDVYCPWRLGHAIIESGVIPTPPPPLDSLFRILYKEDFENGSSGIFSLGAIVDENYLGSMKGYRQSGGWISAGVSIRDPMDVTVVATCKISSGRLNVYPRSADQLFPHLHENWGEYKSYASDQPANPVNYGYDTHSDKMAIYTVGRFGKTTGGWRQVTNYFGEATSTSVMAPSAGWNICRLRLELNDGGPAYQNLVWHWYDSRRNHLDIQSFTFAGEALTIGDFIVYKGQDVEPPDTVTGIAQTDQGDSVVITWNPSHDNVLTAYYEVMSIEEGTHDSVSILYAHDLRAVISKTATAGKQIVVIAWDLDGNASSQKYPTSVSSMDQAGTSLVFTAFPVPSNPAVRLNFTIPSFKGNAQNVLIQIFNVQGKLINTLVRKTMRSGAHSIAWHNSDNRGNTVPSGVYLARMNVMGMEKTIKLIVTK